MVSFILFTLAFLILFTVTDVLQKKVFKHILWSRKATHIGSGFIAFLLPKYLSPGEITIMGILFVVLLGISKWKKILSLHTVRRSTMGELFYPLSISLLALICLPDHPQSFQFSVLILAFSDGLAGVIGEWLNYKPINIRGNVKSLGGSISFFIVTLIISFCMPGLQETPLIIVVSMAILFTLIEFILIFGLDNLLLPLAVAWVHIHYLI